MFNFWKFPCKKFKISSLNGKRNKFCWLKIRFVLKLWLPHLWNIIILKKRTNYTDKNGVDFKWIEVLEAHQFVKILWQSLIGKKFNLFIKNHQVRLIELWRNMIGTRAKSSNWPFPLMSRQRFLNREKRINEWNLSTIGESFKPDCLISENKSKLFQYNSNSSVLPIWLKKPLIFLKSIKYKITLSKMKFSPGNLGKTTIKLATTAPIEEQRSNCTRRF